MLILPTLSLAVTITQMGIPNAVFKLTADKNYNNKKVLISGISLSLINSFIVMILLFLFAPIIANNLLNNSAVISSIYCIALFVPLASINNILRNYFLGKEKVITPGFSQVVEEITRIIVMIVIFANLNDQLSLEKKVAFSYISMCFGEIASTIFMSITNNFRSKLEGIKEGKLKNLLLYKDILTISIPVTGGQLLNSLSNFLQPVILTTVMTSLHYSNSYIQEQYGIINGYVISMLMIPSFINNVIYRIILPRFTKLITGKEMNKIKKEFVSSLLICLLSGVPFSIIFFLFPESVLTIFFSTTKGANILKYCAIPFLITYLQTPISAALHSLEKNKTMFIITVIQNIITISILYLLIPSYKAIALVISFLVGIIFTTFVSGIICFKCLFLQDK